MSSPSAAAPSSSSPPPPSSKLSGVHPEMANFIGAFEGVLKGRGLTSLSDPKYEETRKALGSLALPEEALPPCHKVEDLVVPAAGEGDDEPEIPIRVYRPSDESGLPVLMWYHGGGWVFGNLDMANLNCRKFAVEADCVVVSVDYRLAPEHPYPAGIDDCLRAAQWVASAEGAAELRIDPNRVAVAGDSAGGNLAACVAYRAAVGGEGPPLAAQILVYPATSSDFDRPSVKENAEGKLLTRDDMVWFWDQYVPVKSRRNEPGVSPLDYALDKTGSVDAAAAAKLLSGLPPALIITAEHDVLRDEGGVYGELLQKSGVPTETVQYAGMIHAFYNYPGAPVKEVQDATAKATETLVRAFAKDK